MCYRWMMTSDWKWQIQSATSLWHTSAYSRTSHTFMETMELGMYSRSYNSYNTRQKKMNMIAQPFALAKHNQIRMWLNMPSYAAVMAWPLTSVTNLELPWQLQPINHTVQSRGLSRKFSTYSPSNDCACVHVRAQLLLGAILELSFHGKWWMRSLFATQLAMERQTRAGFTSGLWWSYITPKVSLFIFTGSLCVPSLLLIITGVST